MVAYICNASYSGGGDCETNESKKVSENPCEPIKSWSVGGRPVIPARWEV
jgi:hypothetical protein